MYLSVLRDYSAPDVEADGACVNVKHLSFQREGTCNYAESRSSSLMLPNTTMTSVFVRSLSIPGGPPIEDSRMQHSYGCS